MTGIGICLAVVNAAAMRYLDYCAHCAILDWMGPAMTVQLLLPQSIKRSICQAEMVRSHKSISLISSI